MNAGDVRDSLSSEITDWLADVGRGTFASSDVVAGRGGSFDNIDPGTGLVLTALPESSDEDVRIAVERARKAMDAGVWAERDSDDRERILFRLAELVDRDFENLVTLEAIDTGKPREDAVLDVREAADVIRYYAGLATKASGRTIPAPRRFSASTQRGPVGVCVAITPWNYPLPILVYKLAPALAFGNSVVAKPSELAPLSAVYLAGLCAEAGVPDGIFSVLLGRGAVGAALVAQPGVDKIAFTGSTATGRAIMKAAAEHPTRVTLELGGKSPQIVFASADLDSAVKGVAEGIWTNAGQVCVAGSRLLVEESIKTEFVDALIRHTDGLVLGHALDPSSMMGPLISDAQRAKVNEMLTSAEKSGANLIESGRLDTEIGFFQRPTVVDGLPVGSALIHEEIFGPVLTVETFSSESEAVSMANSTRYGLAAGVWTGQAGQGQRVARGVSAGTVWINTYGVFHPTLPFGGTKASGFGRELGEAGIDSYTEITTVVEDIMPKEGIRE